LGAQPADPAAPPSIIKNQLMKVELFALCDFAADYAGKLNVIGVFDSIFAKQMPAVHPHCCIAVKLRFEKIEEGQKRVRLSVSDADGKSILPPIEIPVTVSMPPHIHTNTIQVVANIGGLKIERFGEYSIDLAVDSRHEASIPFFAQQMPQNA
jgi:hypothetical protein